MSVFDKMKTDRRIGMISLEKMGLYRLIETKGNTKILHVGNQSFAWVEPIEIGEILVTSHKSHKTDCVLGVGYYRLYDVDGEPDLSDQLHLELETGRDQWQGYLLPTGLPTDDKKKARIIPTRETITGNPKFSSRSELQIDELGMRQFRAEGGVQV
jgi:hypothetical protein